MGKSFMALIIGGAAITAGTIIKNMADRKKKREIIDTGDKDERFLDSIYQHLPRKSVITNIADVSQPDRTLAKEELWVGETKAKIYRVGCYSVRISERIYYYKKERINTEHIDPYNKTEELKNGTLFASLRPATNEEIEVALHEKKRHFGYTPDSNFIIINEISAAHIGNSDVAEYHYVYHYGQLRYVVDNLVFIGTVKKNRSTPDTYAQLLLGFRFIGDSHTDEYCYSFSPDGAVQRHSIREYPMDDLSRKTWDFNWNEKN